MGHGGVYVVYPVSFETLLMVRRVMTLPNWMVFRKGETYLTFFLFCPLVHAIVGTPYRNSRL